MVAGVRVHGGTAVDADVHIDDTFRSVPVPTLMGVPLMWKKMSGTGGDDSGITNNIIVKVMADPESGFAPMEWQYGGAIGPAPPVVLARKDKVPFSSEDFWAMFDYIGRWLDVLGEQDDSIATNARINKAAFRKFVANEVEAGHIEPTTLLSVQYPLGSLVELDGLAAAELNGMQGEVAQYSRDRVGVQVPGRYVMAIKPQRLRLIREGTDEPSAKQRRPEATAEAAEAKKARQTELQNKEAMQIAERFASCLHEDVFPELDDQPLFGLGGEYRQRAQDVLAVWQGAVKTGELTEADLGKALAEDRIKELFEATCRRMASEQKNKMATYAKSLVETRFVGIEFESL
mmetsp:Transcript_10156/g.22877  ORF Transcript_10156/g.22877 Transcript_10156/m.22877 type:complete len:346 (-) Transcript_10156:152-1189(-)